MNRNILIQNHLSINSTILRRVGELTDEWLWIKRLRFMVL
jgi:hypothetical protein